jgi:hypothetical protein
MTYRTVALAVLLASGPAPLLAQGGITAGTLLDVPATPRALALQAYASVVGDEGSIFVNPAGMAPIRHLSLGLSYQQGLYGTRLSTAAIAIRLGKSFDVGFGAMYLDLGGDSVVVPDPTTGGSFGTTTGEVISAWNGLAVGALAYRRGMISLGGSVKVLHEQIGGFAPAYSRSTVAGDLGFAIAVFDIMSIGGVVQNLGGGARSTTGASEPLPRTWRMGFTLNFVDPQGTARLMVTTDWVKPPGGDSYWAWGIETGVVASGIGLLGRVGIATGRPASDRTAYSLGAGLLVKSLRVDYAWQPYATLAGSDQRLGVRWIP